MCRSVMALDMVVMHDWMSTSWVLKYSLEKAGESMGEPGAKEAEISTIVSSAEAESGGPRISMSFVLVEYWEMASEIEVASVGLSWWRSGSGEWPKVEMSMRVLIGLTKQPSGAPMVANWTARGGGRYSQGCRGSNLPMRDAWRLRTPRRIAGRCF